jgi:hypothetical protein
MVPVAVLPLSVSAAVALVVPEKVKLPVGATDTVISSPAEFGLVAETFSVTVLEVALLNNVVFELSKTAVSGSVPVLVNAVVSVATPDALSATGEPMAVPFARQA